MNNQSFSFPRQRDPDRSETKRAEGGCVQGGDERIGSESGLAQLWIQSHTCSAPTCNRPFAEPWVLRDEFTVSPASRRVAAHPARVSLVLCTRRHRGKAQRRDQPGLEPSRHGVEGIRVCAKALMAGRASWASVPSHPKGTPSVCLRSLAGTGIHTHTDWVRNFFVT